MECDKRREKITELESPLYVFSTNIIKMRVAGHVVCWEIREMPITIYFKDMN
jgi:hypothetical protein